MTTYITNGRVHTLNTRMPLADTIAIHEGKIVSVGRAVDILPESGRVEIDDLHGQTVIPGLTDAHIHLLEYGLSLKRLDCENPTRAACLERLRRHAESAQPDKWVLGHGWDHNIWPEGCGCKNDLDSIFPLSPVYLTHKSMHSAWVNSAALQAAGITAQTPDPPDGHIEKDAHGEPTGILYESAMHLVDAVLPPLSDDERKKALLASQRALLAMGITRVHDFDTWDCYPILTELDESRLLTLRIVKNIPTSSLQDALAYGLPSGSGSPYLKIGWLKLFADGALGSQTAAMLEPYVGSDSLGMLFLNSSQVVEQGKKALEVGISLAIHAIGDRANREVLNGYEQLAAGGYLRKVALRPRIEHVQLIAPADIPRLASLGVIASMQPIHAVSDRRMAERHWGARCVHAYAWRSLARAGASLIFGSDAPVESPNPFLGLHAALTRQPASSEDRVPPWYPQERLELNEALRAYTARLGDSGGLNDESPGLTPGTWADLCVLPVDIFKENPNMLVSIQPTAVMVAGKWISTVKD